jgi:hypothetical protein
MLLAVESEIVNILDTALTDQVRVLAFPEKPIDQGGPRGVAAVYVRFAGLDLQMARGGRSPFVQQGEVEFEVRLLMKDLRSHVGAYALMESINRALSGWLPATAEGFSFALPGFQMVRMELVERIPEFSLWDWGMRWRVGCVYENNLEA